MKGVRYTAETQISVLVSTSPPDGMVVAQVSHRLP